MMSRSSRCWLVLFFLVGNVAGKVFSANSTSISSSTHISVEALDAMALTTISWTLQGRVVVYFDMHATDALRFAPENETLSRYGATAVCRAASFACGKNITDLEEFEGRG